MFKRCLKKTTRQELVTCSDSVARRLIGSLMQFRRSNFGRFLLRPQCCAPAARSFSRSATGGPRNGGLLTPTFMEIWAGSSAGCASDEEIDTHLARVGKLLSFAAPRQGWLDSWMERWTDLGRSTIKWLSHHGTLQCRPGAEAEDPGTLPPLLVIRCI